MRRRSSSPSVETVEKADTVACVVVASPIGPLTIEADERAVRAVRFEREPARRSAQGANGAAPSAAAKALAERAARELDEYFTGQRKRFEVPVGPRGTKFQEKVWRALQKIPFGETRSYAEIARAVGRPRAARAVGNANHENPVALIVPCHRVIGVNRTLVGYGGGLDKKEWLLDHEGSMPTGSLPKAALPRVAAQPMARTAAAR